MENLFITCELIKPIKNIIFGGDIKCFLINWHMLMYQNMTTKLVPCVVMTFGWSYKPWNPSRTGSWYGPHSILKLYWTVLNQDLWILEISKWLWIYQITHTPCVSKHSTKSNTPNKLSSSSAPKWLPVNHRNITVIIICSLLSSSTVKPTGDCSVTWMGLSSNNTL